MNTDEYRQFLRLMGLTQEEFAALLGRSRRTGQYWANGALSPEAANVAALIGRRPELLDVLRDVAAYRVANASTPSKAKKGKTK